MADHASTTTALPIRRVPSDPAPARVLTSPTPGEILLGSDATGGPVLRIPTTTTREDLRAAMAALADLLARLEPAQMPSAGASTGPQGHTIPAAYRRTGDRHPIGFCGSFAPAVLG